MPKKIMVVDDEPDTVSLVKLILEKAGYTVSTALDGRECLKKLSKDRPDLVLLDIMMPGMTGWDVLSEIRKKKQFNKVKVIFLSVKQKEEYEKHGELSKLYSSYIMKPFERKELIQKIQEKIGKP